MFMLLLTPRLWIIVGTKNPIVVLELITQKKISPNSPRRDDFRALRFLSPRSSVAPLSGWIMESMGGQAGLANWQGLFLLEGAPSIAVGLLVFAIVVDKPEQTPWLTSREKQLVIADLEADQRNSGPREQGFVRHEKSHHHSAAPSGEPIWPSGGPRPDTGLPRTSPSRKGKM